MFMPDYQGEEPVIRTLRLPKSLDASLKSVSGLAKTSVNALAQEVLTEYVAYDQYAQELDYTVVTKAFLRKLLDYLSEEEVREFGTWVASGPGSEAIRFYHKEHDLRAVLDTFEGLGSKYSKLFTFRHERKGKEHTVWITHNMGRKWSVFYEANTREVFRSQLGIEINSDLLDNMLIARFREKS